MKYTTEGGNMTHESFCVNFVPMLKTPRSDANGDHLPSEVLEEAMKNFDPNMVSACGVTINPGRDFYPIRKDCGV